MSVGVLENPGVDPNIGAMVDLVKDNAQLLRKSLDMAGDATKACAAATAAVERSATDQKELMEMGHQVRTLQSDLDRKQGRIEELEAEVKDLKKAQVDRQLAEAPVKAVETYQLGIGVKLIGAGIALALMTIAGALLKLVIGG